MRLIDADKIRNKLKQREINPATIFINEVLIGLLDDAPTIDAVPIVRCENCRFFKGDDHECEWRMFVAFEDDYCSHGERREDADKGYEG